MRIGVRAGFVAACLLVVSCGDTEPALKLPSKTTTGAIAGSGNAGPGTELVAICDGAPDGTPCGDAGSRTYCVFGACVENVCGDGLMKEGEECDDGNQRD